MILGIIKPSSIEIIIIAISLLLFASCYKEAPTSSILHKDEIEETLKSDEEYEWLEQLASPELRGRKTGTEGCRKACSIICEELKKMGYSPIIEEFSYNDSIVMRNVIVDIPGITDSIIVIGAHYDGAVSSVSYPAADDNASGVVSLLSIAKHIEQNTNTILLCFWDGEESTEGKVFNGSRYFTNNYKSLNYIKSYCNIDCCGRVDDQIYLYYSHNMEQLLHNVNLLDNSVLDVIVKVQENNGSDYVSFKNKGIPFWGWNDCDVYSYIHTPWDSMDYISVDKIKEVADATIRILGHL